MGRYGYDYGYSPGRRGIKKSDDPTIKIKPKELGVGALLVGALGSLSGSKNKKQTGKKSDVSAPVSKPKIVKTPPSKPKQLSSKFKKTDSGEQAKITTKARLREIAQENISDTVKKVTGKKDGGKPIPEGSEGAGLRALKAEAPEVTSKMGYKKKGGIVEGINNIKGMKNGGVCRGMGAATKGGSFNVS